MNKRQLTHVNELHLIIIKYTSVSVACVYFIYTNIPDVKAALTVAW